MAVVDQNPDSLTTGQWKDRYWGEVLGLEGTSWSGAQPGCGFEASTSCRDGARMAQLWLNEGAWPTTSAGDLSQVMNRQYAIEGRSQIFPGFGRNYGFTLPLMPSDPIDPSTANFQGLNGQCFRFSPAHQAVIVSMGSGSSCGPEWTNSRAAIVSRTHPLYNTSWEHESSPALPATAAEVSMHAAAWRKEVGAWRAHVARNTSLLPADQLTAFKRALSRFGFEPLPSGS